MRAATITTTTTAPPTMTPVNANKGNVLYEVKHGQIGDNMLLNQLPSN